ncbi:trypsin-like peptidase domain-containing protein [Crenothrix sp.]|uniref:trypsin-like peptidase domain-containing protein n=1 Tax=Crenothrix sp. TaxID=3100433 RepID=UPI00374CB5DC
MKKIIIKYLTGSKINQTQVFELPIEQIVFGRGSQCDVRLDADKDAYVSTAHCKITIGQGSQFLLTDLCSSNGTFLNGVLIGSKNAVQLVGKPLEANDTIQLGGERGVSFIFDVDPRPTPKTKIFNAPASEISTAAASKDQGLHKNYPEQMPASSSAENHGVLAPVIKTEKGIKHSTSKKIINIAAAIISSVLALGIYFSLPKTPRAIHKAFSGSTVLIEMSWKLMYSPMGKQVFQKMGCLDEKAKCNNEKLPMYIYSDGSVQPFLDFESGRPIGGTGSGSGFAVHEDGHILTNRHVVMPWKTSQSVDLPLPGILIVCNNPECSHPKQVSLPNDPTNDYVALLKNWIPAQSKTFGKKSLQNNVFGGKYDYLNVVFPSTNTRIPAHLGATSSNTEAALIKIDSTKKLLALEIATNDPVAAGDAITVMGYPDIAQIDMRKNEGSEWSTIPEVTVTPGQIGRIRAATTKSDANDGESEMRQTYQLTLNAVGMGNNGGPVFNDKGRIIGIFTTKKVDNAGALMPFAIPIKYAQDLLK